MKRTVCVLLIVSITCMSCAGNDPRPVLVYQQGDENKSCSALRAEINNIDKQITLKQSQQKKQEGENILWFITGWLVIIPFFFMDLKENEKAEIDALELRRDALLVIAADKECGF